MHRTGLFVVLVMAVLGSCDGSADRPEVQERSREDVMADVCRSIRALSIGEAGGLSEDEAEAGFRAYAAELKAIDERRLGELLIQAADRIGQGQSDIEGSAFLVTDAAAEDRERIRRFLTSQSSVRSVEYRSSQDAFEEFRQTYRDNPEFYEDVPRDALPASFRFRVDSRATADSLQLRLESMPGVDEVRLSGQFSAVSGIGPELLTLCVP